MKRYTTIFALSMMVTFAGFAQTDGLKGPKAKNYKPWENPQPAKPILVAVKKDVKGPAAKNIRPLENSESTVVAKATTPKKRVMGPEAKNSKPWDKE